MGSKTSTISPRSSAPSSSSANSWRRRTRACIVGAYWRKSCLPAALAEYMATSALPSSSSALAAEERRARSRCSPAGALCRPARSNGRSIASSSDRATVSAPTLVGGLEQDGELVPAQPAGGVALAQAALDAAGDLDQHLVADGVAEACR